MSSPKFREAVSDQSSAGDLGLIVTGIIVWLLGPVTRNSNLTSYESFLLISGWFPGLVTTDNGLVSWAGCCRS